MIDESKNAFIWVTEFPLVEHDETEKRFTAMHHPFTAPREEDLTKFESDPGSIKARAYDLVLNGNEIGGGSIRIHQKDVQEKMFKLLGIESGRSRNQSSDSCSTHCSMEHHHIVASLWDWTESPCCFLVRHQFVM